MDKIKKNVAKAYGLDGDFDELIFTLTNPTNSDVYFDLFNPLVVQQYNVPNTPFGYVQPSRFAGGTPNPLPPIIGYPNVNNIDTYPIFTTNVNNTMAYDSIHSRMYMTYNNIFVPTTWHLTWKDSFGNFTTTVIPLSGNISVIDSAVSPTSNKLFILTSQGQLHIINTNTNTYISILNLPSFGFGLHNRIAWNDVRNSFYITVDSGTIWEVSAITNTVVGATITPVGSNPFGLSFNSTTNMMFVTYALSNQIATTVATATATSMTIANFCGKSNPPHNFLKSFAIIPTYEFNVLSLFIAIIYWFYFLHEVNTSMLV